MSPRRLLFYCLCLIPVPILVLGILGVLPQKYCTGIVIISALGAVLVRTGRGSYKTRITHAAGLDFLDIGRRIERRFGIRLTHEDWDALSANRHPPDLRMGELHDYLCTKMPLCARCRYDLCGLDHTGQCPECGEPFDADIESPDARWEALRDILADALILEKRRIERDSFLDNDLWSSVGGRQL
jgi:hypothetical protein